MFERRVAAHGDPPARLTNFGNPRLVLAYCFTEPEARHSRTVMFRFRHIFKFLVHLYVDKETMAVRQNTHDRCAAYRLQGGKYSLVAACGIPSPRFKESGSRLREGFDTSLDPLPPDILYPLLLPDTEIITHDVDE